MRCALLLAKWSDDIKSELRTRHELILSAKKYSIERMSRPGHIIKSQHSRTACQEIKTWQFGKLIKEVSVEANLLTIELSLISVFSKNFVW